MNSNLIQSIFSLPGGRGQYHLTLIEFSRWLQEQPKADRRAAQEWFQSRFGAGKSAPYYFPVVRDLDVIEYDRGNDGPIRLTEAGRTLLNSEPDQQQKLLADRFMSTFVANREILDVYRRSSSAVGLNELRKKLEPAFPTWTTAAQFDFRLRWFESLGLLSSAGGTNYQITPLGQEYAKRYPVDRTSPKPDLVPVSTKTPLDLLIDELRAASIDSSRPVRFETALAQAFEALGFTVRQLGDSGDTDVLVQAPAGHDSYVIVADAKARASGKVDQLEVLHLKDHQSLNKADYAVVVAGSFAGGKVAFHAGEQGVTLLPLSVLEAWLKLHESWPQDLIAYRSIFEIKGLVEKLPPELLRLNTHRKRWGKLLADIIDLFSETYEHGLSDPLSSRDVFRMLVTRSRGVPYPEPDVISILELLSHPVVGALSRKQEGYSLVMSRETLGLRLRRLAEEVESLDHAGR